MTIVVLFSILLFFTLQYIGLGSLALIVELAFIVLLPITCYVEKRFNNYVQLFVLSMYWGMIWFFGIIHPYTYKKHKLIILLGAISFLLSAIICLFKIYKERNYIDIRKIVKEYSIWIIISAIFIIFSIDSISNIPYCDEAGYYYEIKHLTYGFDFMFSNINDFCLYKHAAIGYSLMALLGEMIHPYNPVSVRCVHILLAIVSAIYLYTALKKKYPEKDRKWHLWGASLYLFSPMIFGTVLYINVDTVGMYFFVILVSAYILHHRITEIVFAYIFVFTKEPNVVVYAFLCIGILIAELVSEDANGKKIFARIIDKVLFYIPEIIIPFSWLIVLNGNLSDEHSKEYFDTGVENFRTFGFTFYNFNEKSKEIFITNYNWLITILSIVLVIVIIKKKLISKSNSKLFIILLSSQIGFLLFSWFYLDNITYRYAYFGMVSVLLIFVSLALMLQVNKYWKLFGIVLVVLQFVQSLFSIDYVSAKTIHRLTGYGDNLVVASADCVKMGDSSVYNREYCYYINALSRAFGDFEYKEGDIITYTNDVPFIYSYPFYYYPDKKSIGCYESDNAILVKSSYEENDKCDRTIYIMPIDADTDKECVEIKYRTIGIKYYIE